MKLKNGEIYAYYKALNDAFAYKDQYFPVKINFFIQKNKTTLSALMQDIEAARVEIIKNYGVVDESTGDYTIPEDKISQANEEINNLFNIEQEVNIHFIDIDAFPEDMSISTSQMGALMFMIQ